VSRDSDGLQQGGGVTVRAQAVAAPGDLTPWQHRGNYILKRDDLFEVNGVTGGKVRTCGAIMTAGKRQGAGTAVTSCARRSPQAMIVARVAEALGMRARVHVPSGSLTEELDDAQAHGAEIVQHHPGRNSVLIARAREDKGPDIVEVPFGMECQEAVTQTALQVRNIPISVRRLVVPVGSGMSLAGIVTGLEALNRPTEVLGVVVGADPTRRLDAYAPLWRLAGRLQLAQAQVPYERAVDARIGGVLLDPHYEAKVLPFLRPGDGLWVVGIRGTLQAEGGR
jgi:1-aminocyclopropane-1-carboxylate deaminase/D-cysteine desulfhydrase-like pyridoxal-dependent ACC family enzyme